MVRLAGGGLLIAGAVAWQALARDEPPMDGALLASVRPAIHEQLPRSPEVGGHGVLTGRHQELRPRWFCAEKPIEIRRLGNEIRVGLIARCAEYGLRGGALVTGTGSSGAMVVAVTGEPGEYRLSAVEWARDGAAHSASVRRMFTPAGTREALQAEQGGDGPGSSTMEDEARRHFRLPPDAPVLPD